MSEQTAERLTKVYVKIREKRKELAKQDEELKEQLDLISNELLSLCDAQGATTIRTEFGTISRRQNKNYWSSDWEAMYQFIKDNNAFPLLQQRIHNNNMIQFLEENPDLHPPGLQAEVNNSVVIIKR